MKCHLFIVYQYGLYRDCVFESCSLFTPEEDLIVDGIFVDEEGCFWVNPCSFFSMALIFASVLLSNKLNQSMSLKDG
jgi:hypothetical protein